MTTTGNKYAQDGVNISVGDQFSRFAASECKKTWQNSPHVEIYDMAPDNFRGPRAFRFKNLPDDVYLDVAPDGIGTKVVIISEAFSHFQAGRNLMAMTFGDLSRWGGKAYILTNVLDVAALGTLDSKTYFAYCNAMRGLVQAAHDQHAVLYRGETAELGVCVGSENPDAVTRFNWAGFAIGLYRKESMITGEKLRKGQSIVALKERGFRSNGLSSVRAALREEFGRGYDGKWWLNPAAAESIHAAAEPSALYDLFLTTANGWSAPDFKPLIPVTCIAHLSGGAIPSKFADDILFPLGLSAELDDLWEPPYIVKMCGKWRGYSNFDFYRFWCGGQGVLAVMEDQLVEPFIALAAGYGIEAKRCGRILAEQGTPTLTIKSKYQPGLLEYTPKGFIGEPTPG